MPPLHRFPLWPEDLIEDYFSSQRGWPCRSGLRLLANILWKTQAPIAFGLVNKQLQCLRSGTNPSCFSAAPWIVLICLGECLLRICPGWSPGLLSFPVVFWPYLRKWVSCQYQFCLGFLWAFSRDPSSFCGVMWHHTPVQWHHREQLQLLYCFVFYKC